MSRPRRDRGNDKECTRFVRGLVTETRRETGSRKGGVIVVPYTVVWVGSRETSFGGVTSAERTHGEDEEEQKEVR